MFAISALTVVTCRDILLAMQDLLDSIADWEPFSRLLEGLNRGERKCWIEGLEGAAKCYLVASLWHGSTSLTIKRFGGTALLLTPSSDQAERLYQDLIGFLSPHPGRAAQAGRMTGPESAAQMGIFVFPSLDVLLYEQVSPDYHLIRERLTVLQRLSSDQKTLVIATPAALLHRTLPPPVLEDASFGVSLGDSLPPERLASQLVALGYEREEMVEIPGQFSVRGGIVDIFPSTTEFPVRLEFLGDEVESLRTFDPQTQRSQDSIESFLLLPAREIILSESALEQALPAMESALEEGSEVLSPAAASRLDEKVKEDLQRLSQMAYFPGLEYYLPFLYPEPTTLLDYLPPDSLVILDEPTRIEETYRTFQNELDRVYGSRREQGRLLPLTSSHYLDLAKGMKQAQQHPVAHFSLLPYLPPDENSSAPLTIKRHRVFLSSLAVDNFAGSLDLLALELATWQRQGRTILLATSQQDRLMEVLGQAGVTNLAKEEDGAEPAPGKIMVSRRRLSQGFHLPDLNLVCLTDQEIFGRQKIRRPLRRRVAGVSITSLTQLEAGDYVVHINHGIGQYQGLVRRSFEGGEREYMLIKYDGPDQLYVPADQLDRVQKYLGAEDHHPPLNRLGGWEWERTKQRVRRSARHLARELLVLQAKRESQPGHSFAPDSPWQHEMEDSFLYEETPDQAQSIVEVKRDMEQPKPMDRLVCGDVGYGKTEVAVRAAFKAVLDGEQVAVLVPTTVLAQQHDATFRERLAAYPVRVEMLSRFKTHAEQSKIVEGLQTGSVDIVIGTHRLLSRDIRFRDLGLVVIDEEQRFGVRHKEKLKQLRATVDVLTMTATPIPRTSHLALAGIREMSIINDPPEGRMPIITQALPYDDDLIREAVLRELDRNGQVYFVHNRVESIGHIAARLQRLVPSARIAVAHGQLREEKLEQIMLDFYAGEYDLLVCTTIIESGLDIPNVNTIIIDHAERFGLAQLYQLRGRVGRSDRQAYAYLTWTPFKHITDTAEKRIAAIREFSDLGSGFKLALRDLELRGAGNILGPEQHGFLIAVGFDLYCQMLADAVKEEKGEPTKPLGQVSIDLPADGYLPEEYVPSLNQRIGFYRRMAGVRDFESLNDLRNEMRDRFGRPLPACVQNLFRIIGLKLRCFAAGIESIATEGNRATIKLMAGRKFSPPLVRRLSQGMRRSQWSSRLPKAGAGRDRVTVSLLDLNTDGVFALVEEVVACIGKLPFEDQTPASVAG